MIIPNALVSGFWKAIGFVFALLIEKYALDLIADFVVSLATIRPWNISKIIPTTQDLKHTW